VALAFSECRASQVPAVRAIFAQVYRPDSALAIDEALFRWQFGPPPTAPSDTYHMKLAIADGEIVGCLGYVPVEFSCGGRIVGGAWTANWVIVPGWRRLGLGPLLLRDVTRGFAVTLVAGLSPDALAILPRMGWTSLGELIRYIHVLDAPTVQTLTATGQLAWPAPPPARIGIPRPNSRIQQVPHFSEAATQLWDTQGGRSGMGTRRSAAFLNWRYAQHPVFAYRLFEAHEHGQLRGIAIYRVERVRDVPVRVGRIVELVGEEGPVGCLLQAIAADAQAQGVALLDFFCTSARFARVLAQEGFLSSDDAATAQIPLLFQPIDRMRKAIPCMAYLGNLPGPLEVQDWYVTKGDGDQDRPA